MNSISIDTTSDRMSVAVSWKDQIFYGERKVLPHSYESVVTLIAELLARKKITLSGFDCFGVCVGPGSFTGIRIGISAMKALAYSTQKPLIGFRSLDIFARSAGEKARGLLCVVRDAKRNNLYSALFKTAPNVQRLGSYMLSSPEEVTKEIRAHTHESISFISDAPHFAQGIFSAYFPKATFLARVTSLAKIKAMVSLTEENFDRRSTAFTPTPARHDSWRTGSEFRPPKERRNHTEKKPRNLSRGAFTVKPFYMYPKDCQVHKKSVNVLR